MTWELNSQRLRREPQEDHNSCQNMENRKRVLVNYILGHQQLQLNIRPKHGRITPLDSSGWMYGQ